MTANPLDMGYPQFSFGGQFTTMGDPALFTFRSNHDVEFADNLTMHRGKHTAKFGVYAMGYRLQPVNPNGARGIFSFTPRWTSSAPGLADGNAFADFLLGYPTTAQVGLGRADMDASVKWIHLYAQDSWQLTPRFKVDAGLRYEYNPNMTEARNRMAAVDLSQPGGRFVIASDGSGQIAPEAAPLLPFIPIPYVTSAAAGWDNSLLTSKPLRLAPRVGFAWSPASPQTVVRGGFGIYPNQAAYSIITNFAQNLPFFVTKTVSSSATAASPSFSTANALAANTVGTAGANNLDHDFAIEYNEVWNLNVEREVAAATRVSAAYIGSRTVHADSATVRNVPLPGPGAIAARRPVPQLSQFNAIRWDGWATYHALMLEVKRSFTKGLMFNANWTWSHSIDDASDPGATLNETNLPQDVRNMAAEKASSSFDHRHRLAASFVYQLPALSQDRPRAVRALLGRWQAGGYFTAQLGAPFTVNIASDQANIGAGPAQRPNVSGDPNRGPKTPDRWFDTTQFSLPALFTFGNLPRNAVIGPGLFGIRPVPAEGDSDSGNHPAAVSRRGVQSLQPPELQHPQPDRLHGEFRPNLERTRFAATAVSFEISFLTSEDDAIFACVEFRGVDAGHFLQIVERLEIAVLGAVLHHRLRGRLTDVEDQRKFRGGRGVYVDLGQRAQENAHDCFHLLVRAVGADRHHVLDGLFPLRRGEDIGHHARGVAGAAHGLEIRFVGCFAASRRLSCAQRRGPNQQSDVHQQGIPAASTHETYFSVGREFWFGADIYSRLRT